MQMGAQAEQQRGGAEQRAEQHGESDAVRWQRDWQGRRGVRVTQGEEGQAIGTGAGVPAQWRGTCTGVKYSETSGHKGAAGSGQ